MARAPRGPAPFKPEEAEDVLLGNFRQFHIALAKRELELARTGDRASWAKPQTFVDNRLRASPAAAESVRMFGKIEFAAEALDEVARFIWRELERMAERVRLRGNYRASLRVFAPGANRSYADLESALRPGLTELRFYPLAPYSRKLELGQSSKAKTGIFKAVYRKAKSRYGRSVRLTLSYTVPRDPDARIYERTNRKKRGKRERGYETANPVPIIYLRQGGDFT